MIVESNQIFNLMDTNGRRSDVLNALKIYLEILEELKEGKISSYQEPAYVEQVKVFYNPANEADLEKY